MSDGLPDIKASITFTDAGASATLTKVAGSAKAAGEATKGAGDAAAKAATGVGVFGSTVGLAGQALGKMNPVLGQTVTMAGSALGSIQALTTAGMGPLGIAVAAVSLAVSAGTALYGLFAEKQREAKRATDETTAALWRNADGFDAITAARERLEGVAARFARLQGGTATGSEYTTRGTQLAEEQRLNQIQNREARSAGNQARLQETYYINARLTREIAENEERRARAVAREAGPQIEEGATLTGAEAEAEMRRLRPGRPRRGGGGGSAAADRARATAEAEAADVALRQKQIDDAAGDSGYTISAGPRGKGEDTTQAEFLAGLDRNKTALETMEERDKAASDGLKAIYEDTFGAFQAGLTASMDAMINGGASAEQAGLMMVAAVANQLSKVAMMKGLEQFAEGLGSLASYDYPGAAQHFAAAGAWTLVGAAAGVAGGALSAASKPSGASGPSTGAGPSPRQQSRESEGARNVTVIFSGGVITAATEAQLGRTVRRVIGNTALGGT